MPNCGSQSMRSENWIALDDQSKCAMSGITGSSPRTAPNSATARESVADGLNVNTKMPDTTGTQMRKLKTDGRCICLNGFESKARPARRADVPELRG